MALQSLRFRADCDPTAAFNAADIRQELEIAAKPVRDLEETQDDEQHEFAARVLLPSRRT